MRFVFWIVYYLQGPIYTTITYCQTESSKYVSHVKLETKDYVMINGRAQDTIWCKVTKTDKNQIFYTTPNKDEWVRDFQDYVNGITVLTEG